MLTRIPARAPTLARARGFASSSLAGKERLVILGSGWGGYNLARKADKSLYDVTVISPNSYFSFTPFLASTCVGTLDFMCATEPVRGIKKVNYGQGWAESVDLEKRTVHVVPALPAQHKTEKDIPDELGGSAELHAAFSPGDAYDVPYDKLVVATGCRSASFGTPGVIEHAHFLKDVREARAIRYRLLQNLEIATEPHITPEEKKRLLSVRVVGGGPTGVEFAAELCDFVTQDVYRIYPHLKNQVSITLYDLAPGILQSFDASLRSYAERKFKRSGVEVRGNTKIVAVGKDYLELASSGGEDPERVPYGLLVWNTGLQANPFIEALPGLDKDPKSKSLRVDPHLRVCDADGKPLNGVFAIGDNATPNDGHRLPATAQVASQMAGYMAKLLKAAGRGEEIDKARPFKWKDHGSMVFIGDYRAMVDRSKAKDEGPRARMSGFVAWVVWRSYYMTLAMGWRNKILIPVYWALAFFFGRDVTNF
ncbi:hypothetical protein CspeluHIS016_0703080 [Cutaneotrichosporon spelunceum]|uniref:FAD/NAD(P)-binding domain-containing protein n=1 Tax=Cutaneotrichosporon spelunceum TaxID=1672016 RepID=A0AAD3TYK6_9TREE|nr:hypothetical protein CspeluHIS016_0703080 [Cutaneotrichosporon spelunceum]